MRRLFQLSVLFLAVGLASACSNPDQIVLTENIPTAGVRFINAVPDTNAMDFRFIDIVENSAHYKIGFRNGPATSGGVTASAQVEYKNTRAGSRHLRIFLNDTSAAVASTVLRDTVLTIEAGKLYTAVMYGNARAGAMQFAFIEEGVTDPAANVGLRLWNLTGAAVDGRAYASTGVLPAAVTWSVPAYSKSTWVPFPPAQIRFNVQPVGGGASVVPEALGLIGAAASSSAGTTTLDIEGLPGTTQAGSDVTAIIFPPSVSGSKATNFAAAGMTFMWDRRPPRPAGT